ncbi:hypothetical protein [Methanobacterium petrolearium]|uniref:hypothetical protein n=1 Tax=Methanobacterium petrolearium TaxID=710190 RepID=UPI001AE7D6A2|nr:hypothetical protein [Methanobacterium petrolearium]MBP1947024.1 hypothetical protein [Methanobacterium petrolearium]BDZ71452.1 hypothetical protein GCM10025861_19690 [Methanobacterium petrolearium]
MSEIEKEIIQIKFLLEKIEGIIDSRLIGEEDAEEDEIKKIIDFENRKKAGELELNEI